MNTIRALAFYSLLGKPVIFYFGVITFLCLLFTASISILNHRGIRTIPFKWHPRMARITIAFAFIHAILAISFYI